MKNLVLAFVAWVSALAHAADFNYQLVPQEIAADVYAFVGQTTDFNTENGGNIVNTGFIVAPDGVIVVDTGPSLRYGQQMRAAIGRVTRKPVVLVLNTHHHPDHFLGNQAFSDVPVATLAEIQKAMAAEGNAFAENLYRMSGDWMAGTEVFLPTRNIGGGALDVAGRHLQILALEGHTGADLAIYDASSGVLFAGDLVFNDRAPTTPHAQVERWLRSLSELEQLTRASTFRALVPGHGAVTRDASAIARTRDWLTWLTGFLRASAATGMDMTEVIASPLPSRFKQLPMAPDEYRRSVGHLYPAIELEVLEKAHAH